MILLGQDRDVRLSGGVPSTPKSQQYRCLRRGVAYHPVWGSAGRSGWPQPHRPEQLDSTDDVRMSFLKDLTEVIAASPLHVIPAVVSALQQ
jgi:hypothetical protein